jgi:HSP20 family molecular chaperone IbpA
MAEKDKIAVSPNICSSHDTEKYVIEIELPGVSKKDVTATITSTGFCVTAPREEYEYSSCYTFAHPVDPDKSKAKFQSGLLTLTLPFKEEVKGKKLEIT